MKFLQVSLAALVFLLLPVVASAEPADVDSGTSAGNVDVSSSTAGIRIGPDAIKTGLRARVKAGGAVPVCFNYVDRSASCATALTSPDNAGFCASPGDPSGYVFIVHDEHFRGQVCAILSSGSTPVKVPYNAW